MNYSIFLCGKFFQEFDTIAKLFIQSAEESDYKVNSYSYLPENLKSPFKLKIELIGSLKKDFEKIIIDFDNLILNHTEEYFYISPNKLNVKYNANALHYWHLFGKLVSIIQDISPAFVTGYLLEKNMKQELEIFRQYLS